MKPVLIVDRNRLRSSLALARLDRCGIPAFAVTTLDEALELPRGGGDPPAVVLIDLASVSPVDEHTRRQLSELEAVSGTALLVGISSPAEHSDPPPCIDLCVARPASADAYRKLLWHWCSETEDHESRARR